MEIVRDIASIVGMLSGIFALWGLLSKTGQKLLTSFVEKQNAAIVKSDEQQSTQIKEILDILITVNERLETSEEVAKQECRDKIKDIYYKYCDKKVIPLYDRKTADANYKLYTEKLNGNSYAALLYGQITSWEIDPSGHIPEN